MPKTNTEPKVLVGVRVTPEQKAAYENAAKELGITLSDFFKKACDVLVNITAEDIVKNHLMKISEWLDKAEAKTAPEFDEWQYDGLFELNQIVPRVATQEDWMEDFEPEIIKRELLRMLREKRFMPKEAQKEEKKELVVKK